MNKVTNVYYHNHHWFLLKIYFDGNRFLSKQVLQWFLLPNIVLNVYSSFENVQQLVEWIQEKCSLIAGDWDALVNHPHLCNEKYDFILTSETIYSSENYAKLVSLIKRQLAPDGMVLIAAKTHYFGVGGSIFDFEQEIVKDNTFNVVCVKTIEDSVERQILKITWK